MAGERATWAVHSGRRVFRGWAGAEKPDTAVVGDLLVEVTPEGFARTSERTPAGWQPYGESEHIVLRAIKATLDA